MDPMTKEMFLRNLMFYGEEGFARLQESSVAVVGLGGVGSFAAEALVRAGIGKLRIIDCDILKATDVNRHLLALSTNLDISKVEAGKFRLLAINPDLQLDARHEFFHFDTAEELITQDLDFVVDAIDSMNPKAELIRYCTEQDIRIISALGSSCRSDPFALRLTTLNQTANCPLARALRRLLRRKKVVADPPVLYSMELPITAHDVEGMPRSLESVGAYSRGRKRQALPSISTLPGIVGLMVANYVIFELLKDCR